MKKVSLLACLTAIFIVISSCFAFGEEALKIVDTYPENNQKNTTVENMCVKLHFNNPVGDKKFANTNKKAFTITGPEKEKLPILVLFNPKNNKEVLVLVDVVKVQKEKLKIHQDAEYTLHIDKDFTDNQGNILGKNTKISFSTINQQRNNTIYMVLMGIMMVVMVGYSAFSAKRHAHDDEDDDIEKPFNPYREAKKTGKSVAEVVAQHEKEVAKKAAKRAKKKFDQVIEEAEYQEELKHGHYKVKNKKAISTTNFSFNKGKESKKNSYSNKKAPKKNHHKKK